MLVDRRKETHFFWLLHYCGVCVVFIILHSFYLFSPTSWVLLRFIRWKGQHCNSWYFQNWATHTKRTQMDLKHYRPKGELSCYCDRGYGGPCGLVSFISNAPSSHYFEITLFGFVHSSFIKKVRLKQCSFSAVVEPCWELTASSLCPTVGKCPSFSWQEQQLGGSCPRRAAADPDPNGEPVRPAEPAAETGTSTRSVSVDC